MIRKEAIQALAQQIIKGVASQNPEKVFTSRGNKHYMENWD